MSFTKTTHFISYLKQVCFSFSRQCPLLTQAVSHINLHFPCTISIPKFTHAGPLLLQPQPTTEVKKTWDTSEGFLHRPLSASKTNFLIGFASSLHPLQPLQECCAQKWNHFYPFCSRFSTVCCKSRRSLV